MLDGIDYYPGKTRKKPKIKIWLLVLIALVAGAYIYVNKDAQSSKAANNPTLIVINKAEKPIEETTSIIIKSDKTYQPKIDNRVKSDKALDELIQTFKKQ